MQHCQMAMIRGVGVVLAFSSAWLPCECAIVDLVAIEGKNSACPGGFAKAAHAGSLSGDLNQGSRRRYLWLCVKHASQGDPITDLAVVAESGSEGKHDNSCGTLCDYRRITASQGSDGDFNQGTGGKYIYLCYKKDPNAVPLMDLRLQEDGSCQNGMSRIRQEAESNGDFNQKAHGKDIFMCVSKGKTALPALPAPPTSQASPTCFGLKPIYQTRCSKIRNEKGCLAQSACGWGDPSKALCFAANHDPMLREACRKWISEAACTKNIGCAWRSPSDQLAWVNAINDAAAAIPHGRAPIVPSAISMTSVNTTSHHDKLQLSSDDVASAVNAWRVKYGLEGGVVSALKALVAVESTDFKQTHLELTSSLGNLVVAAAGGRNYNGFVSLAFAYSSGSTHIDILKPSIKGSCEGKWLDIVKKQLQAAIYPKFQAEATLLKDELKPGVIALV